VSYFLSCPVGVEQIVLKDAEEHTGMTAVEKTVAAKVAKPAEILDGVGIESAPPLGRYVRFTARPASVLGIFVFGPNGLRAPLKVGKVAGGHYRGRLPIGENQCLFRIRPVVNQIFDAGGRSVRGVTQLWPVLLALTILLNLAELVPRKWQGVVEALRIRAAGLRPANRLFSQGAFRPPLASEPRPSGGSMFRNQKNWGRLRPVAGYLGGPPTSQRG
jgi:hypothetical protein